MKNEKKKKYVNVIGDHENLAYFFEWLINLQEKIILNWIWLFSLNLSLEMRWNDLRISSTYQAKYMKSATSCKYL